MSDRQYRVIRDGRVVHSPRTLLAATQYAETEIHAAQRGGVAALVVVEKRDPGATEWITVLRAEVRSA